MIYKELLCAKSFGQMNRRAGILYFSAVFVHLYVILFGK